jgi:hypothetical protein
MDAVDRCTVRATAALNERAIGVLTRVVDAAPRNGGTEMERAVCKALMDLSSLYTIGRTAADGRRRTQASIDVCDEIIGRWEASWDGWLRLTVAGARLNKAMSHLELGDEPAARHEYERIVQSFPADGDDGATGRRLSVAKHAREVLDTVRIPEPEFKVEYLEAQRRRAQRRFRPGPEADARRLIHPAHQLHRATAGFVRHATCIGEPWVLLLRNFDLTEKSIVTTSPPSRVAADGEPEVYGKAIYFTAGLPLINHR